MALRSLRERVFQTLCFELGGLLMAVPLYMVYADSDAGEGATLMALVAVAVMIWSPVHNTLFDWVDLRLSGRVASDRPQLWRVVHAISHEISAMVVVLPILVFVGGLSVVEALLLDVILTFAYSLYAYVFHRVFDWLRPVRRGVGPFPAGAVT